MTIGVLSQLIRADGSLSPDRARYLVERFGQDVKWRAITAGTPTAGKPWLTAASTYVEHDVTIIFLPEDSDAKRQYSRVKESEVPAGMIYGLMGYYAGLTPRLNDIVVRDSIQYKITYIDVISPSTQPVLYRIGLVE